MPDWVYTTLIPGSIVGWFLMLALLSYAGGWSALAREYREDALTVADGPGWHFQSGSLKTWCGYNGCLVVVAGETGLRLSVWAMFQSPQTTIGFPSSRRAESQDMAWSMKANFRSCRSSLEEPEGR